MCLGDKMNPVKGSPLPFNPINNTYGQTDTQVNAEKKGVEAFNSNSKAVVDYQEKLAKIQKFSADLPYAKIKSKDYIYSSLESILGTKIASEFRLSLSKQNLSIEDCPALLSSRDAEQSSPMDKIKKYLDQRIALHQAIAEIEQLKATLETADKNKGAVPTLVLLTNIAKKQFTTLCPKAMDILCETLWKLDGSPHHLHYGYETAVSNILGLLNHKEGSAVEKALNAFKEELKLPLEYKQAFSYSEKIDPSYPIDLIAEIQKIYQLKDFQYFLADPSKNNAFLISKYEKMHPEMKKLISTLVWIACDQPNEIGFGENFIKRAVRSLLTFQNDSQEDLIVQLMKHTSAKIKLGQRPFATKSHLNISTPFTLCAATNTLVKRRWFKPMKN